MSDQQQRADWAQANDRPVPVAAVPGIEATGDEARYQLWLAAQPADPVPKTDPAPARPVRAPVRK